MAVVRTAGRAAAAAFLLGLSVAASPGIAAADEADTGGASAGVSEASAKAASPGRATRGPAAGPRQTVRERPRAPRPAAARVAESGLPPAAAVVAEPTSTEPTRRARRGPDTGTVPGAGPAATRVTPERIQLQAVPPSEPAVRRATPDAAAVAVVGSDTGTAQLGVTEVVTPQIDPAPVRSRPAALATVAAVTGTAAATSVADLFNALLAPIRELFEGVALLVRRTFFNEAPTVTPVQLTGQSEGLITGIVGAVDPEGDPLVYRISQGPRFGSAVVSADGSYSYTPGPDFTGSDSFIVEATDTGFHINLFDLFRAPSGSGNVVVTQGELSPRVYFNFIYGAGAQHWSSAARSSLEFVAATLSSYIVVTSPVTVTFDVTGESSPFSSTLASAGSDLTGFSAGYLQTVVQNKIQTGVDANGSAADGTISWNFGPGWAFGSTVPGGQYDFQSTAMHELLHTLGFLSNITDPNSNTGQSWTAYDGFLVTSGGVPVIGEDYTWISAYTPNLTGGNGGLYFGGTNAVAVYGGPVPLYTPNSWSEGSSVSHLNDVTFTGANEKLMNARVSTGPGVRVISPLEFAILQDLGYTIVPGSGSVAWAFVAMIVFRRRRRD